MIIGKACGLCYRTRLIALLILLIFCIWLVLRRLFPIGKGCRFRPLSGGRTEANEIPDLMPDRIVSYPIRSFYERLRVRLWDSGDRRRG